MPSDIGQCILCDDMAIAWPEYATDYVKAYPLCDYHMTCCLKWAKCHSYDNRRMEFIQGWEDACNAIEKALDPHGEEDFWGDYDLGNKVALRSFDPEKEIQDISPKECRKLGFNVAAKAATGANENYGCPLSEGDPVRTRIEDDLVDKFICSRVSYLATRANNGQCMKRCCGWIVPKGEKDEDGYRCYNYVRESGDTCKECKKRKRRTQNIASDSKTTDRLIAFVRSLSRSDEESDCVV